jgi:hypothetical protein
MDYCSDFDLIILHSTALRSWHMYTQVLVSRPETPADETSHFPRSSDKQNKEKHTKEKQDKAEDTLPLILLWKKKRVAGALAASFSPFLLADVPSAWCSQRSWSVLWLWREC